MWKRIEDEGYPVADDVGRRPASRMVLITDGVNVNMAHWFSETYAPRTHEKCGAVWANQHYRLIGNAHLSIEDVTHWAEVADLLMPVGGV